VATASPPQGANPPQQVVRETINQTNPGWLEHQQRIRRFDKAYDVYRANVPRPRGANARDSNAKDWRTRLYVKYGMQVIDQCIANMVQGMPRAVCTPRRQQDEIPARAMEVVLGYYGDQDHLDAKEEIVIKQGLLYGVSPGKTMWCYREGNKITQDGPVKAVESDRPTFIPWNAYDCWWDPYARDVDCSSYVVLRDWLTKEDLLDRQYNEQTGVGQYQNLDILFRSGPGQQPPSTAQNRLMGQVVNPYKDRFEILEVWRDDRLTVVGNRQVLLADGPKPYWMNGKPCVVSSSRPDLFKIEGISETELVDDLQQALWMVANLRMDNLKFTVMRGATYRETLRDPSQLVLQPAFLWPVTDHDDIDFKDAPPLPREAYEEEETLLGRLQYVTGISPYVTGATGTGVDQNTATGVSLLSESASRLLTFKANQIRMNTWQRVFEQWGDLTKQFLTNDMALKIEGPGDTYAWVNVGPNDIAGEFDVRIQAGSESLMRQQERSEAIAVLNALAPFAQMGLVDVKPLLEKLAQAYDLTNLQALFPAPQPQAPQAAPTPQLNPTNPPMPGQGTTLPNGFQRPPAAQEVLRGNR
jgi:hypothetical protein